VPAVLSPRYTEQVLWQAQARPPSVATGVVPPSVDVAVVGAGYCGLAAATELARHGRSVVVLEKEALGWGASTRNGGMVIPELKAGPAALERSHGPLGRRLYAEVTDAFDWVEELIAGGAGVHPDDAGGIECDYHRSGQLYLAHSARQVPSLEAMATEHARLGEPVWFVPRDRLGDEIGSHRHHGAVVLERTGGLHPARFHAGLARRALAAGAVVHDRTAVRDLVPGAGRTTLRTTHGDVEARDVLLATNAYADGLLPELRRRVLPVGSYIIATEVLDAEVAADVSPTGRMMVDTKNFLFYWRLTPDGRMAFGGRRSLDPTDVADARDFLYDSMVKIHPQLGGVAVDCAWGGNVAVTLDRLPHVGRMSGAWYATGCNGSGVALNTWLGHRLGLVIVGEAAPPAFAELRHRPIPLHAWRSAYLPFVSRWFSWQDRP
jgi:glycine/D-amino acid oxidase-like deaminating enzyme